jgi:hypothetical protein
MGTETTCAAAEPMRKAKWPACAAPRREKTYDRRQRLKSVVQSNTPPTTSAPGIPESITGAGAARQVAVAQELGTGLDNAAVAAPMRTQAATAKELIAALLRVPQ